ncbi:uncharacterized protein (TIGR02246 family) [Haloactinospora alba]|uniref:Uncharacterized protein (TIGR02246 family) n=1 Tax=Haloactinospora alba TaxID=405555 RepID=A0A543NIH4_9ACTN|nr:SgcJ/EcaC family oxidoreductase [Haloactinospora alba]TQN31554.1 uncharacterized protein (TIGR02246 family) [Haloactinospora alba]
MNTVTSTPSEGDQTAIRELVSQAQEWQNTPEHLLSLHTPDVVIVNLAGRRVLGREAYGEAMSAALASPLREVRTRVEVVDIRLLTRDTAVVSCVKTVHDGRSGTDGSEALPGAGALTYTVVRTGGAWRIALAQTTPIGSPAAHS